MKVTFPDKIQHKPYDSNPRVINNSDINQLKQAVNDAIDGAELAEEIEARIASDNAILSAIADLSDNGVTKASQTDLDEEIANRINDVEAEKLSRIHQDEILNAKVDSKADQSELDIETNARLNADGYLQSQISNKALASDLTFEIAERKANDASFQNQLTAITTYSLEYVTPDSLSTVTI